MSNEACCQICILFPGCRAWTRTVSGRCELKSGIWELFPRQQSDEVMNRENMDTGYIVRGDDDTMPMWTQADVDRSVRESDDKRADKLIAGNVPNLFVQEIS